MSKHYAFGAEAVPEWALRRPKPVWQAAYDLLAAPLRMAALPDSVNERLHLTSLRAERFATVLPHLQGRVLDVGAGDNALIKLYQTRTEAGQGDTGASDSVGIDVEDWGTGTLLIDDAAKLPFEDNSFDRVVFVACINHITNRDAALREAWRVLKPGGQVLITMINRLLGNVGHAIWWYSEDKHRDVDPNELMGMDKREVIDLLHANGYLVRTVEGFVYGLNRLYVAEPKPQPASDGGAQ